MRARKKRQGGQAVLLMVLACGLVLAGALGLAIDVSMLYPHTQMAQAAADSAAEAGVASILGGTWSSPTAGTCTNGSDTRPPCLLALKNGFGASGSSDVVSISLPSSIPGVTLTSSGTYPTKAVQVTITRPVTATFIRMVGGQNITIKALAVAGLVQVNQPIPILILDKTASGSLTLQGNPKIQICGGSQTSIQVNSNSSTAIAPGGSAQVDLSKGGPADTNGDCTTPGTGTDLRVYGGPPSSGLPSYMTPTGSTEHYYQPSFPISDPYASVSAPTKPADGTTSVINSGTHGCSPQSPSKTCTFYTAGHYSYIDIKGDTAVFSPGVYYIDSFTKVGNTNVGFGNEANGIMAMCSDCSADTSTNGTGNTGMMVYLSASAGVLNVGANAGANLSGSSTSSVWEGLLFYQDRGATNIGATMGGNGAMSLTGTIYLPTQTVTLQGGPGSGTFVQGEIIVDELVLGGKGNIQMNLNPNLKLPVIRIALVK